jgi:preprotein translocase subunit SecE
MVDRPAKRRVKDPETFRQRAMKAAERGEKPAKRTRVRGAFGKVFGPVFRPIGRGFVWLFAHQPFKTVAKIARFIGRILVPRYFRGSWGELRLVTWPTWKQSRQLTFAVLIFAIIFGAVIAAVDWGLDKVFRSILLK